MGATFQFFFDLQGFPKIYQDLPNGISLRRLFTSNRITRDVSSIFTPLNRKNSFDKSKQKKKKKRKEKKKREEKKRKEKKRNCQFLVELFRSQTEQCVSCTTCAYLRVYLDSLTSHSSQHFCIIDHRIAFNLLHQNRILNEKLPPCRNLYSTFHRSP